MIPPSIINARTGANWKAKKNNVQLTYEQAPSKMRPANKISVLDADNPLNIGGPITNASKHRPIKHWRKQNNSVYPRSKNTKDKNVVTTVNVPGGTTIIDSDKNVCVNCPERNSLVPKLQYGGTGKEKKINPVGNFNPLSKTEMKELDLVDWEDVLYLDLNTKCFNNPSKCKKICDPPTIARKRVLPTNYPSNSSVSNYYTSSKEYLQSRCQTYTQNLGGVAIYPLSNPNSKSATMYYTNCTVQDCNKCCKIMTKKYSNPNFSKESAVDSGARLLRLKYNTITKAAANGNLNNWASNQGLAIANALAYSSNAAAPFTYKTKLNNGGKCESSLYRKRHNFTTKCLDNENGKTISHQQSNKTGQKTINDNTHTTVKHQITYN